MERIVLPPSAAEKSAATKEPYIFESFSGDKVYVSGTHSVARFLLTGKATDGKFSIPTSGGQRFPTPEPNHHHKHDHHDLLGIRCQLKVWPNYQWRILRSGNCASVAPVSQNSQAFPHLSDRFNDAVHVHQFIGDHFVIFSRITPVGFEHMFRGLGELYTGPM
ncbi:quercetin 2 3-dioxygenase [Fusarium sp. NRRL 52700]|nr:quercetin 2 3-dioxygenase [Fusarium sp. NRRL 52700]